MAVEVDPYQGAGDAALVAGERPGIGRAHGINGRLLAGDGIADGLDLGEFPCADDGPDIGAGQRVIGPADFTGYWSESTPLRLLLIREELGPSFFFLGGGRCISGI